VILEANPPIDETADEGSQKPSPEGVVEVANGMTKIEGKSDHDGAGGYRETKQGTLTSKEEGQSDQ
jgi:hypothetical protein